MEILPRHNSDGVKDVTSRDESVSNRGMKGYQRV